MLSAGAAAQPLGSEQLPPLPAGVVSPAAYIPESPVSWQLHQQYSFQPGTGQGRLELLPSLTVVLHDPTTQADRGLAATARLVQALEEAQELTARALAEHQDFLMLQEQLFLRDFYGEWLVASHRADQRGPAVDSQEARVQLRVKETESEIERLLLRLQSRGIVFSHVQGHGFSRPTLGPGADSLAACLTGSRELARLELLSDHWQLETARQAAERELRVELSAGLSLAVTGAAGAAPEAGWNAGLVIRRADYGSGQLQFDLSPHRLQQSFTIRGPEATVPLPRQADPGLHLAMEQEAIRLRSLLNARELAADWEQLLRNEHELQLSRLQPSDRSALDALLDSTALLLQAVMNHDLVLLQLAAACNTPLMYLPAATYP